MNSAKAKAIHIVAVIFVAAIMIFTMVTPALAQQGPQIRVTYSGEEADQADVAIDSQGNVHIAYCDWFGGYWGYEIFYTMLDNNGNTLIEDTMISEDDEMPSRRPAIIVDSSDKVHIVWQQRDDYYDGDYWIRMELYYTKLDPSLDDQDGDAADESVITEVDDTCLTDFGWYYWGYEECEDVWPAVGPPRIDIDSGDNIHIVFPAFDWCYYDFQGIYYMQIDSYGNINIDVIELRDFYPWRANPDVAVDSHDNPHITWNDDEDTDTYEIYYMMLDSSDGSTLIDATLITPDDDCKSKRQSIVVDSKDKVHIIWQDQRYDCGEGVNQIYYTKLDPSLDDQSDDAADESVITLIDDKPLTPATKWRHHPTSAIRSGYIHIAYYYWDADTNMWDVHYQVIDTNGNTVVLEVALTTGGTVGTSTKWTMPYLDVDSNGKAHIVWCDNRHMGGERVLGWVGSLEGGDEQPRDASNYTDQFRSPPDDGGGRHSDSNDFGGNLRQNDGGYEVYYTNYQWPPCEAPPPGVPALTQWGAVGMIIALAGSIVWKLRRRKVSLNVP